MMTNDRREKMMLNLPEEKILLESHPEQGLDAYEAQTLGFLAST